MTTPAVPTQQIPNYLGNGGIIREAVGSSNLDSATGAPQRLFVDPMSEAIDQITSLRSYFSDDFGGAAVDATKWDVLDGGLGAVTVQPGSVAQTAIGTGTTGITHSVASSSLAVVMGTTNGAEKWFLSKQIFCCTEDIMMVVQRSQALAANMIQIGLVEVDPITGYPYQNGTVSTEFTNKAAIEFGQTAAAQSAGLRTISDNSPAEFAPAATAFAPAAMTTAFETLLQIRAEDIHAHSAVVDTAAAKTATVLRASSQVPNDTKVYKLLMRFKNVSVPGTSTTFTIYRILVQNHQAVNVSVAEGPGGQVGSQAIPVNIATALPAGTAVIGGVIPTPSASSGGFSNYYSLVSLATTNPVSVKNAIGSVGAIMLHNNSAAVKYLKMFNKATAPTVGTDTPILNLAIPANAALAITSDAGMRFPVGIAIAVTGGQPALDNTAVAAGDVVVNLAYI